MNPADLPSQSSRVAATSRAENWSRYWSSGALHSCVGSFTDNYSGEVQRFWMRAFAGLDASSRLLELCCGNGPVAKLLVDALGADARLPRIDATDIATPAPTWLAQLSPAQRAAVHFHAGVAAETLPFAAHSFDLVASQFGIEYSDVGLSLAEVRRVLKPHSQSSARFCAVLHHRDSLPVRNAQEEIAHLVWLRDTVCVYALASALIEPMARSATVAGAAEVRADPRANDLRAQFNGVLQQLPVRAAASSCGAVLMETAEQLMRALQLSRSQGAQFGLAALNSLRRSAEENRQRLDELVACALDKTAVGGLAAGFSSTDSSLCELHFDRGDLLGWGLTLSG